MQQQKWQFEKSQQVHCGTKNWWMVIIALTEVKFMVPKCIVGTYRSLIEQAKVELIFYGDFSKCNGRNGSLSDITKSIVEPKTGEW